MQPESYWRKWEPRVLPEVDIASLKGIRLSSAVRDHYGFPNGPEVDWWIYFIQGDDGGPIKIGRSRYSPVYRLPAIQLGYPFGRLRCVGYQRGSLKLEKALHRSFAHLHVRCEWFAPGDDLCSYVQALEGVR